MEKSNVAGHSGRKPGFPLFIITSWIPSRKILPALSSLLEGEEQNDALVEIAVVKVRLVQLHHQEVLTLQNIFNAGLRVVVLWT